MPIQTACSFCSKPYTLDDGVLGKKVRCKSCDKIFVVAAGGGIASPAAAKPRAKTYFDDDDGPAYDLAPTKPMGAAGNTAPEMAQDGPCPACGIFFPAANAICLNCGYNRWTGEKPRVTVLVDKRAPGHEYEYRYDGVRKNTPFVNPAANFLEQYGYASGYGIWRVSLYAAVGLAILMGILSGPLMIFFIPIFLFIVFLYWGVFYYVIARGMDFGVDRAASIMKFETPDNSHERVIAVSVWAQILSSPFQLLIMVAAGLTMRDRSTGLPDIAGLATSLLVYYAVHAMFSYLLVTCFFRLRWIEGLVAWIFMTLYGLMAMAIVGAVQYGVFFLLAAIVKSHPV